MRKLTAGIACLLALAARPAGAVALPDAGAEAAANASAPGASPASDSDSSATTASATATANGDDFAEGTAQSTVGGSARSNSQTSGASSSSPSNADASASWVAQLVTAGTDPGGQVDIDLALSVDGVLTYFNNNSGAGPDGIRSSVGVILRVHDESGAVTAFSGTAKLATVTNNTPPALTRTGDWAPASRDGDFSTPGCGTFSCQYDVSAIISFNDAVLVDFGSAFAVELVIDTDAFIFSGNEVESGADFFNTASVSVTTDTAGVTIESAPSAPAPVPVLPLWTGLALAGLVLVVAGRRMTRSDGRG